MDIKAIVAGRDMEDGFDLFDERFEVGLQRRVTVLEEDFGLRPALFRSDDEPLSVRRQGDSRPILLRPILAPDEYILGRVAAERVIEDVAMIRLLALGDLARLGITRVVKALAVRLPGEGTGPRPLDLICQILTCLHVENVQRRQFAAVGRQAVSEQFAVAAWGTTSRA